MKNFLFSIIGILFIAGSIYLFLNNPAPVKYTKPLQGVVDNKLEIKPTSILFVGDIMLDRSIRGVIVEKGFEYLFEDIQSIFTNNDLVIGNLEGTITNNPSISSKNFNILHFTFATTTAVELKNIGFSGFSQANNHSLDFYQDGYEETKKYLNQANLFSFGSPYNNQDISYQTKLNNENLCFIGYHSLYSSSTESVIGEIAKLKPDCSFIVVFAHWGEEYKDFENKNQKEEAYSFIDAGADLIIGAHPHVIEPLEIYKNKAIFYSLGNFMFDQDFSLATREGMGVKITLDKKTVDFKIIPLELTKGKSNFSNSAEFSSRMNILISKLSEEQKNILRNSYTLKLSR